MNQSLRIFSAADIAAALAAACGGGGGGPVRPPSEASPAGTININGARATVPNNQGDLWLQRSEVLLNGEDAPRRSFLGLARIELERLKKLGAIMVREASHWAPPPR